MAEKFSKLYLIRHGNTDWSETHRYTGRTDLPLNARGEANARGLQPRLKEMHFSHVFVSPLQRARKTCELSGWSAIAEVDPDLYEWDYGKYDGLFSADVHRDHPDWNLFRDGGPGGESPAQIAARADRFIAKVRGLGRDVAAFGSGHIIRVIASRWLGQQVTFAANLYCSTASIGILGFDHDDPAIHLWNDDGAIP